jgi:hypothetical protein
MRVWKVSRATTVSDVVLHDGNKYISFSCYARLKSRQYPHFVLTDGIRATALIYGMLSLNSVKWIIILSNLK